MSICVRIYQKGIDKQEHWVFPLKKGWHAFPHPSDTHNSSTSLSAGLDVGVWNIKYVTWSVSVCEISSWYSFTFSVPRVVSGPRCGQVLIFFRWFHSFLRHCLILKTEYSGKRTSEWLSFKEICSICSKHRQGGFLWYINRKRLCKRNTSHVTK